MVTQRIVLLSALVFYLCVVVKERAESFQSKLFTPRPFCFGKLFSASGGFNPPRRRASRYCGQATSEGVLLACQPKLTL